MRKNYSNKNIVTAIVFAFVLISTMKAQTVVTFTNAANAANPHLGTIQTWTVPPCVTTVTIEARGAQGGFNSSGTGGNGARMIGVFTVTPGQLLYVLAGKTPGLVTNTGHTYPGGGGGSFVGTGTSIATAMPMIAAGGGGGGESVSGDAAPVTTSGTGGSPGTNGNGAPSSQCGGGGGGFFTSGGNDQLYAFIGGSGFRQGGNGGTASTTYSNSGYAPGGFGGGAPANYVGSCNLRGGNGGGYSGGSGYGTAYWQAGTAGGSFNGGTNQTNTAGFQTGHGLVNISYFQGVQMISNATPSAVCNGTATSLNAASMVSYTWLPVGTFLGSNNATVTHVPSSTTQYTVLGTNSSGCTSTAVINVIVTNAVPVLSVVSSTNQTCFGKTATLTASGAVTYTWTNGVTNGVSFLPQATTAYTVSGENGCGITTAVSTISVDPLPMTIVSTHTAVCANKTATLSVTAAATSYTWAPGNIVNSNSVLIVSPQVNTIYTVSATDGTCSGVVNVSIQSDPVPTVNASASSTVICPGGSITLSVTGGSNYTWTPGNQNGSSIVVNPAISTLYNVVGDNAFGCLGSAQQVIVVGAPPNVVVSASNFSVCSGSSSTLNATGANSFAWTNGPTTNNYAVTPMATTIYTVVGTDNNNPCTAQRTLEIAVITPSMDVTGNTTICKGGSTNLTGTGVTSYTWAHVGISGAMTNVSPVSNTSYTLNGVISVPGLDCPTSKVVSVVVNSNPVITVVPTRTSMCVKETNTLTVTGADSYTWANTNTVVTANTLTITSSNATVLVYSVTGVNAQNCSSTVNYAINISACTGINELTGVNQITIYPNPNNGEFVISADKEMSLNLINELGQVVKQINVSDKNDHKVSISNLSNGIYFIVGEGVNKKIMVSK